MRNIHVRSTDKPSRFSLNSSGKYHLTNQLHTNSPNFTSQHIYITSDEEIKDGNYAFDVEENIVFKVIQRGHSGLLRSETNSFIEDACKKIILTTDQDLIKDGVQCIDDEFLKWFVQNARCELIEVEKENICGRCHSNDVNDCWSAKECGDGKFDKIKYKIIIPKEEPKKFVECKCTNGLQVENCNRNCGCRWARIVNVEEPKQENCCTPIGQIKRYKDCIGCDRKPKQETLEEAAGVYVNNEWRTDDEQIKFGIKVGFIEGAKWQRDQQAQLDTSKVNRVEVIRRCGIFRWQEFLYRNSKDVRIKIKDEGTTLEVSLELNLGKKIKTQ